MEESLKHRRRKRKHRGAVLNEIENKLASLKELSVEEDDVDLWRWDSEYKPKFSTQETWRMTRRSAVHCSWAQGIWFSQATPKFSFMAWLATLNRLSTLDRVSRWDQNLDTACILCKNAPETRNHLFFQCSFSSMIWEQLAKGILCSSYTEDWDELVEVISSATMEKKKLFCLRYAFQAVLYAVWRERNRRKHGESAMPSQVLIRLTDKAVRNKLSLLQSKGVKGFNGSLQLWFATRV